MLASLRARVVGSRAFIAPLWRRALLPSGLTSRWLATAAPAAKAKPAAAAAGKPAAAAAVAAGKPAASAPAKSGATAAAAASGAEPKYIMKRGMTSYLLPTSHELTMAAAPKYMSKYQRRLGRRMKPIAPIALKLYGEGLKADVSADGRVITVAARMGSTSLTLHESVAAVIANGHIVLSAVPQHLNAKAMMGTTRAHLANMIHGVHFGHTRRLQLVGIGYRAKVESDGSIELRIGFSHPAFFRAPAGVKASMPTKDTIAFTGIDVHAVMLAAAELRRMRPPNAYTGQGIRYSNERFVAKPGKKKSS